MKNSQNFNKPLNQIIKKVLLEGMYSDRGYQLTKKEYEYLLPVYKKNLTDMNGRYYFTDLANELSDVLNRLKGLYDNYNEKQVSHRIVQKCFKMNSIEPFRESMR